MWLSAPYDPSAARDAPPLPVRARLTVAEGALALPFVGSSCGALTGGPDTNAMSAAVVVQLGQPLLGIGLSVIDPSHRSEPLNGLGRPACC